MKKALCLVVSGEAGQGIQTLEEFLLPAIAKTRFVCSSHDIMSRVRGGNNTMEVRISSSDNLIYQDTIDAAFLLNDHALDRLLPRMNEDSITFCDESWKDETDKNTPGPTISFPLLATTKEAGGSRYQNTVLLGFILGLLDIDETPARQRIQERFQSKGSDVVDTNHAALELGRQQGERLRAEAGLSLDDGGIGSTDLSRHRLLNGSQAIRIGALAGGCDYVASYPMSPSTGVLVEMARHGTQFDVLVEQAEDEIAALNMVLGAWFAGARAMATTSGGGLALMQETLSLSGITETPCVLHVAQRPGPATGLPTRTEQGDLNLALYAGHGEFARIILAPGDLREAVLFTKRAFELADRYQVPVFLLSDQFFTDSTAPMPLFELPEPDGNAWIVKTDESYQRYRLTPDGVSPRGIPGWGEGLVRVDSDEHDEDGLITESFTMRDAMNKKRLGKRTSLLDSYMEESWFGEKDAPAVLIGWGSSKGLLREWFSDRTSHDVCGLHLGQLCPLPDSLGERLRDRRVYVMESNATGQLAAWLSQRFGLTVAGRLNKSNGAPLSPEDLESFWNEVIQ